MLKPDSSGTWASLRGKVAIVTGGAQGLGQAFARGLAMAGASVVVTDIQYERAQATAAEIRESGANAMAIRTDVADENSTIELARGTLDAYGGIDILVNNAALSAGIGLKPITEITLEEWTRVMAVNAGGPFLCCKAVLPHMKARRKGKIINISSGTFWRANSSVHYTTSKGGLIGFTRQLAREVGDYGICVNCVTPGLTTSEGVLKHKSTEFLNAMAAGRCFKRLETPDDLVGTIVFLASDASDFITGQTINVDGGGSFH